MDEKTRRIFVEELESDRTWARKVFGEPHLVTNATRRGGIPIPDIVGDFLAQFATRQQTNDLDRAIDIMKHYPPKCLDSDFKHFLVTILESDSEWLINSAETGYSELLVPSKEVCDNIHSSLDELRALPTC
jgi:hypothetical protein